MKKHFLLVITIIFIAVLFGSQEKAYASTPKIIKVDAGKKYNIVLKDDGTVWSWGDNTYGQLGDGTYTNRNYPVQVIGLSSIVTIDAGPYHCVAVKNDGTVWIWGKNDSGQLGDGTYTNKSTPMKVAALSGIVDISCGKDFTIAVKNDGTLWTWGFISGIGLSYNYNSVTPINISSISNVTSVKAGEVHVLALKSNGELWTWGRNDCGQCGDGSSNNKFEPVFIMSEVSSIGTGDTYSFAIKKNGTIWGWGRNTWGQLGNGKQNQFCYTPVQMIGATNAKYITGGDEHTIVLKNDGTAWVCGADQYGELGDGITYSDFKNEKTTLNQLPGINGITSVSAGAYFTVVTLDDGSVWGCGLNDRGQLGE